MEESAMKRLICVVSAAILCVSALFCGCSGDDNPSMSSESIPSIISIYTDICNDGELYCDSPNARLNFIDFKSMKGAIICPSPNCPHNDPDSCPSFGMMNHPLILGDRLYYFLTSISFNEGKVVESTAIYSAEPDGTGKKKLASIDEGILNHYNRAALVDDKLYFCLTKSGYDEFGSSTQTKEIMLYSYSLTDNKFAKLKDIGKGISAGDWLYGVFNGEIYISFSYLEKEATHEDFMNPDTAPQFQQILYKYNIADGGLTECKESISGIQNGWIVLKNGDGTILRNESGKDITIPTDSDVNVVNGFAFDIVNKAAYDLSSGRHYSLNIRQEYCEIIYYIDESYIIKSPDNKYEKIAESELIGDELK